MLNSFFDKCLLRNNQSIIFIEAETLRLTENATVIMNVLVYKHNLFLMMTFLI